MIFYEQNSNKLIYKLINVKMEDKVQKAYDFLNIPENKHLKEFICSLNTMLLGSPEIKTAILIN